MFVYSMKATTLKFFGVICVALITLIVLITFIEPYQPVSADNDASAVIQYTKMKSVDDVKNFLLQFGWQTSEDAIETKTVSVPKEFDRVLMEYNEIQKLQSLNLEKYKGKEVLRYTFIVENYPNYEGKVYANVLVYKNKVIGGDICAADPSGFLHGFEITG